MQRRLVRCVPHLDFMASDPPRFLYTSGRPNRCNPRGVDCLYFSEDERTADAEYRRQWRGTDAETQPKLTFFARVDLRRIPGGPLLEKAPCPHRGAFRPVHPPALATNTPE